MPAYRARKKVRLLIRLRAININVTVGWDVDERIIVTMDNQLHPIRSDISDSFIETLESWPDSLTNGAGPADKQWRARWLATSRRFEAGHWPPQPDASALATTQ